MTYYYAGSSKGQIKIQQMAFVLVAIIIFFAIVALFYLMFRVSNLKADAAIMQENEAKEMVQKLAGSPEFSWTGSECSGCIDLDKILVLRERRSYKGFWNLDYLMIERVYPLKGEGECTKANYPNCKTVTLVNSTSNYGIPLSAFVALCSIEERGSFEKCELGKIYAAGKQIK